jgi:hypothetical protein
MDRTGRLGHHLSNPRRIIITSAALFPCARPDNTIHMIRMLARGKSRNDNNLSTEDLVSVLRIRVVQRPGTAPNAHERVQTPIIRPNPAYEHIFLLITRHTPFQSQSEGHGNQR